MKDFKLKLYGLVGLIYVFKVLFEVRDSSSWRRMKRKLKDTWKEDPDMEKIPVEVATVPGILIASLFISMFWPLIVLKDLIVIEDEDVEDEYDKPIVCEYKGDCKFKMGFRND